METTDSSKPDRNEHLNIFRFFSESESDTLIENNFTRALSICLLHNEVFLHEFLNAILSEEEFNSILDSEVAESDSIIIDLQQNTRDSDLLEPPLKRVYAIAMTAVEPDMEDLMGLSYAGADHETWTDILIRLPEIAIIIEAKLDDEDCRQQLRNQVEPLVRRDIEIHPKDLSWQKVIRLAERAIGFSRFQETRNPFVEDFLARARQSKANWFNEKPLGSLNFTSERGTAGRKKLDERMRSIFEHSGKDTLSNRIGIKLGKPWAREILPEFGENQEGEPCVLFNMWPGSTKGQGESLWKAPTDWLDQTTMSIDGTRFELKIRPNLHLRHYAGKWVSGVTYDDAPQIGEALHTHEGFREHAGLWKKERWGRFEELMQQHLPGEDGQKWWREKVKWQEEWLDRGRSFFALGIGYTVTLFVPYKHLQDLDHTNEDADKAGDFVRKVADELESLIP